jgi:hypothetical protein
MTKKPILRVHHNNSSCPDGRGVTPGERLVGTGGHRLCEDCASLNRRGR